MVKSGAVLLLGTPSPFGVRDQLGGRFPWHEGLRGAFLGLMVVCAQRSFESRPKFAGIFIG